MLVVGDDYITSRGVTRREHAALQCAVRASSCQGCVDSAIYNGAIVPWSHISSPPLFTINILILFNLF